MTQRRKKNRDGRRGTATLELALSFPLMILMTLGAIDFGRLFHHAITASNAAASGAFYGMQSPQHASGYSQMMQTARNDADSLAESGPEPEQTVQLADPDPHVVGSGSNQDGIGFEAARFCACPGSGDDPGRGTTLPCASTCGGGYGRPQMFVRVRVAKPFSTVAPYPGVPDSLNVRGNAFMRVR